MLARTPICSVVLALCLLAWSMAPTRAHEGHDHGKPVPLTLPVAPRVVAVTPDFELVAVTSGKGRLTVFLHAFATNEPVKGASMTVSAGEQSIEARPESYGVFSVAAPWLDVAGALDLVFALKLADGTEDLLTGSLGQVDAQAVAPAVESEFWQRVGFVGRPELLFAAGAGLVSGILLTLLLGGGRASRKDVAEGAAPPSPGTPLHPNDAAEVRPLRRSAGAVVLLMAGVVLLEPDRAAAADAALSLLPSVPSTMATDLAQRMPDGTLFVPKATQHLLSIRTMLTVGGTAALATELTGTVMAGPTNFGRVQSGRPGRIEATPEGLAHVGKLVKKGELLAYVQTYIEAADRANIDSLIAETEGRIEKNKTILSRYMVTPGAVPQVKVDEVRGEIEALTRKREELLPSVARREPVVAPISGVISLSNATIGQIVEARDVLFEIVDPSELWVEAHGYGQEATALPAMTAAFAIDPQGHRLRLAFAGRGLILRNQASISTFRILDRHDSLAVGMPVKIVIQSAAQVDGVVIPSSAIVRGQTGLPIVWIKTDAERFEPQAVKTVPLDGESLVVTSGLEADMRVVTDGVALLNQVR